MRQEVDIASRTVDTRDGMVSTVAVGVDESSTAAEAVTMAVDMARRFDAELVLLTAYKHPEGGAPDAEVDWATNASARQREVVARTEARVREQGVRCRTLSDAGHPADVLVRLAGDCGADILVVGNKGMQRKMLGSVPNAVTHKADCSVLVVKTT